MRPLRHSHSFPTLPSSASLTVTPPPNPNNAPSQPPSPSHLNHPPSHRSSLVPHPSPLPSPHPIPPPSSSTPFSPLYVFPPQPLTPPPHFLRVESSLYRCSVFGSAHFPFLSSLRLKSVLAVSPDPLPSSLLHLLHTAHIPIHHLHHPPHSPHHPPPHPSSSLQPSLTPPLLKTALEYILHAAHHPLLLLSTSRCSPELCVLVGCLRRVQGWCVSSVVEEYERGVRVAGEAVVDAGRVWLDEVLMEGDWAEVVWVEESQRVRWWRDTVERHTRKLLYQQRTLRAATEQQRQAQREQRRQRRTHKRLQLTAMQEERERSGVAAADADGGDAEYEARVLRRLSVESEEERLEEEDDREHARRDALHADEDRSLDRLLFSNPHWRLISEGVTFDRKLSIIEDDED